MPIYEYRCKKCGHKFEEIVFSSSGADDVRCPECGDGKTERLMSAFATSGTSKGADSCGPAGGSGFS